MSSTNRKRRCAVLVRRDGDTCWWCDIALTDAIRTVDHVIPLSAGGSNRLDNLVLACEACNAERGGVHGPTANRPGLPTVPNPDAVRRLRQKAMA
jgi:5-methylcytosine-specific restriction endonuclease McrA